MAYASIGIECTVNLPASSDGLGLLEGGGDVGTGFEMTDGLAQDPVGRDQGLTNLPVRLPEFADVGNDLIAMLDHCANLPSHQSGRPAHVGSAGPRRVERGGGPQAGG